MTDGFFVGPWFVDATRQSLRDAALEVALSENEVSVLKSLASARGEPVSREVLLHAVLGYAASSESRAIDACLRRLRRKLGEHPDRPDLLRSRRGVGVYLVDVRSGQPIQADELPPPGRAELATEVRRRVADPGLVTLVGASGIGKTRLARHICNVEGGIWVDALSADTAEALVQQVAHVSGFPVSALEQGFDELLVLDNFEQLPDHAAHVVARWSEWSRVLVTSIRPLRVLDESIVKVPPLDRDTARSVLTDQAEQFAIAPRAGAFEQILDRVDGHPLALLLLAPMAGALDGLDDAGLLEITAGWVDGPQRHASLSAAIERGLSFVGESATEVLEAAAAFHGRFRLDALAAVAERSHADTLASANELVRHSLMEWDGDCYHLLPAVRMFAQTDRVHDALRRFLLNARDIEMRSGRSALRPYARDLVELLADWDGPEAIDLLFAAEVAGNPPHRLKAAWEHRRRSGLAAGDVAGVRSYLCRASGSTHVDGVSLSEIEKALRDAPATALSLFERRQLGERLSIEDVRAVAPRQPTAIWVNTSATLLDAVDEGAEALLQSLRLACEKCQWWDASDYLESCLALVSFRRGDLQQAHQRLRDLPWSSLYPLQRVVYQLVAWELGLRDRAVELNALHCRQCEEERGLHQLLAGRALGAAFAWLAGEDDAVGRAEAALSTRHGGRGLEMDTVARLVLVLAGRADSSGDPEVDAALRGQAFDRTGPRRRVLGWLIDSTIDPRRG